MTSNGSGTYPGMIVEGMDILLQVRATSGEGYYGMSWWFFTLDGDGDGFYDSVEEDCGSDPADNDSVCLWIQILMGFVTPLIQMMMVIMLKM